MVAAQEALKGGYSLKLTHNFAPAPLGAAGAEGQRRKDL